MGASLKVLHCEVVALVAKHWGGGWVVDLRIILGSVNIVVVLTKALG